MNKNRLKVRSLAYIFAVGVGTLTTVYLAYVAAAANTTIGNNISTSGTLTVGNTALFSGTLRASSTLQVTGATTLYGVFVSTSTATSTFANGLNLSGGCFAINGTCLTSGGGGGGGSGSWETVAQETLSSDEDFIELSSLDLDADGDIWKLFILAESNTTQPDLLKLFFNGDNSESNYTSREGGSNSPGDATIAQVGDHGGSSFTEVTISRVNNQVVMAYSSNRFTDGFGPATGFAEYSLSWNAAAANITSLRITSVGGDSPTLKSGSKLILTKYNPTGGGGGGGGGSGTINSGTTNRLAFYSGGTTLSSANFLTLNTGSSLLGIGTTSPTEQLSVAGRLYVGGSGTSTIENNLKVLGNLQVGAGTVTITGNSVTFSGNLLPSTSAASTSATTATTTLDSNTNTNYASLAIGNDGLPIIAYYDGNNGDLIVTKCGNASCTSGNASTTVDSADSVGQFASIAVPSDGLPIISYYDQTNDDLKVVKCGNASCGSGNTITTVDSGSGGSWTSIAIGNDDLAVISYNAQTTNGDLKVAKCNNADCSSSTLTTVESAGDVGYGTYITVPSDGLPVISYRSESGQGSVRMAKCGNASCSSGNQVNFIADAGTNGVGSWTSVAVGPKGLPLIVYQRNTSDKTQLGIVECGNSACNNGLNNHSTIEINASSDIEMSVAIGGDGLPVIVTTSSDNFSEIAVGIKCGNSSCSFANKVNKFDYNVSSNSLSMKLGADGFPVVVYQSSGDFGLVFAKCNDEACSHSVGATFTGGSDLGSQSQFFHNAYIESVFANQIKIKRFDLAEDYFSKGNLEAGEIVALDPNYSLYIKKADQSGQGRVIGIVSSEPALVLSDYLAESGDPRYPVALAGRVPVKVNMEGGVINVGDPITLSSESGVGKRAAENSVIVGYALENYSGQIDGKILAFVDLDRWAPEQTGETPDASLLSQAVSAMKSWLEEMKIFIENGLLRVKELVAEKLTANLVDALKVKTKNIELTDSVTGEIYCVGIANGEWQKTLGDCAQEADQGSGESESEATTTPEVSESSE